MLATVQGSEAWLRSRMGKVTASRVADVMAKTKTGPSASRQSYMDQLVVEILTGQRADSFSSTAMQWGTDTEPLARAAYEARVGEFVDETGFHLHPRIEQSGASPDGLIGEGLLEIKCPQLVDAHRVPGEQEGPDQVRHPDAVAVGRDEPALVRLPELRSAHAPRAANVPGACRAR